MPELPEVETIVRGLRARVVGRRIRTLRLLRRPTLVGTLARARRLVAGRRIAAVRRRGKYLLYELSNGCTISQHLRMTGRMLLVESAASEPHERLRLTLDDGSALVFSDQRTFGRLAVHDAAGLERTLSRLGPEPLGAGWTAEHLATSISSQHRTIKAALLDQRTVAGIGNIYADEALFQAGIRPLRRASSLRLREVRALHAAVRDVLRRAIRARGTTFRSYRDARGEAGSFYQDLAVYGRGGRACRGCRAPLRTAKVAQRTTVYCASCQV